MKTDMIVLGALFLDQEFRFMGSVERNGTGIVELAFHEEERGKDLFLAPGGSAANTAIQAARLGAKVRTLGKLGKDPFGSLIVEGLEAEGIDAKSLIRGDQERTGITVILSGKRAKELDMAMVTYSGANETLELSDLEPFFKDAGCRVEGGIFFVGDFFSLPRLQPDLAGLLAKVRKLGLITALDHGRFLRSKIPERVLKHLQVAMEWVDVYLPSEKEIREFTQRQNLEDALRELRELYGVRMIAVKRGAKGCRLKGPKEDVEVPAFPIRAGGVSALGAGSAFNGAFLLQLQKNQEDLFEAGRVANAAGRIKIVSGHQPTMKRLQDFLDKEPKARTGK